VAILVAGAHRQPGHPSALPARASRRGMSTNPSRPRVCEGGRDPTRGYSPKGEWHRPARRVEELNIRHERGRRHVLISPAARRRSRSRRAAAEATAGTTGSPRRLGSAELHTRRSTTSSSEAEGRGQTTARAAEQVAEPSGCAREPPGEGALVPDGKTERAAPRRTEAERWRRRRSNYLQLEGHRGLPSAKRRRRQRRIDTRTRANVAPTPSAPAGAAQEGSSFFKPRTTRPARRRSSRGSPAPSRTTRARLEQRSDSSAWRPA